MAAQAAGLVELAEQVLNSLTTIGPYMAHRFSWALFKHNNFSNFCPFATLKNSKCSLTLQHFSGVRVWVGASCAEYMSRGSLVSPRHDIFFALVYHGKAR